jgi:7,8-dihydroneopterin aldolase/epimerase/oxygenase
MDEHERNREQGQDALSEEETGEASAAAGAPAGPNGEAGEASAAAHAAAGPSAAAGPNGEAGADEPEADADADDPSGKAEGGEQLDREREAQLEQEQEVEHEFEEEEEDDGTLESVTIEISGLSIYTHHGVSAAEREVGQRLVLDLRLELGESDATATDRIEDTVDYAEVCQLVTLVAQQRSHRTLERLCSSIADRLIVDYELEGVWVKAAKPEPPIPLPVEEVSVEVWREPGE